MKKNFTPFLAIAIALLSGCQKNDEWLIHKPNADVKQCAILRIMYPAGEGNDVLEFSYNSVGDPVSISRQLGTHTGYPNFVFRYDEKNRLTDFIATYNNNTTAEYWHRYFYDSRGDIILDSSYIFPRTENGFPENAFMRGLTFYTYDHKRRIIRDSTIFSSGSSTVHSYAYDADGNKVGSTYDDKINVNRTNEIWMFLNRDYSVNNPFKADSYTASGFPSSLNLSSHGSSLGFLGNNFTVAQITYACDVQP